MNKVFVTGASGFVGKNLLKYLREKQVDTVSFSRSEGGNYESIDPAFWDNQQIDVIVHLAGKAHDFRKVMNAEEYYKANTELTQKLFDSFLESNTSVFVYISSIKALADSTDIPLTEHIKPKPLTDYGKSKLAAEEYLLKHTLPFGKRLYILRPCMIHGPGNKGNLNLLYKLASKQIPWPLAAFQNKRSFCSIDNFCFIINELIEREDIPSGSYNVADDELVSTNELIQLIAQIENTKPLLVRIPKRVINVIAKIGDILKLPLNSERLLKLTESYLVSNSKLMKAIGKPLPLSTKEGLIKTFKAFNQA